MKNFTFEGSGCALTIDDDFAERLFAALAESDETLPDHLRAPVAILASANFAARVSHLIAFIVANEQIAAYQLSKKATITASKTPGIFSPGVVTDPEAWTMFPELRVMKKVLTTLLMEAYDAITPSKPGPPPDVDAALRFDAEYDRLLKRFQSQRADRASLLVLEEMDANDEKANSVRDVARRARKILNFRKP